MSEGGHNSGADSARQQQAMNHGKGGKGGDDINLNKFNRDAEYMKILMEGKDVQHFNAAGQTLAQLLGGDKHGVAGGGSGGEGGGGNSSGSSVGRGGGADAVAPAAPGPSANPGKFTEDYYVNKDERDKGKGRSNW